MYKFMLNETSYHGAGAIKAVPEEIKARGFKKVFVASDPDLVKFGVTKKVTDLLDEAGIEYVLYSNIKPNPTIENVLTCVAAFKEAGAVRNRRLGLYSQRSPSRYVFRVQTKRMV